MLPSEEFTQRYKEIKERPDALGRVIGVRRLKPSQQVKVSEMTPALEGETEMTDDATGKTIRIPRRSLPMVAASVAKIDDVFIPFPRNRAELDSIMDRLDEEGLLAAVLAFGDLVPSAKRSESEGDSDSSETEVIDSAKK